MMNLSRPKRAAPETAAPSEVSLNEMLGAEGEVEAGAEPKEYPMLPEEMQTALEEMGWTVTPPAGAEEVPAEVPPA